MTVDAEELESLLFEVLEEDASLGLVRSESLVSRPRPARRIPLEELDPPASKRRRSGISLEDSLLYRLLEELNVPLRLEEKRLVLDEIPPEVVPSP
jgi:hypothetical protein